jgi:hypothetical protein
MKTQYGPPLLPKGIPPSELFNETELGIIKKAIIRQANEAKGRKIKVEPSERALAGELLQTGRKHGYYPAAIKPNGDILWRQVRIAGVIGKTKVKYLNPKSIIDQPGQLFDDIPELQNDVQREAKIAELRRQVEQINRDNDDIPF